MFSWGQSYIMAGVTQRTVYRLRRRVDEKLGRLPLAYFDGQSRGDILSRVTNDIDNISQTLQQSLTQLITSVLTVIGVLIMMLTISPLLAVISLITVPLSIAVTVLIAGRSQKQFVAQWARTGSLNGHIEEMHTGHSIVKVFGRQPEAIEAFDEQNEALYQASYRAQFISGLIQPALTFISNINYVLICVIGGIQVANGQMSLGDVQAFIQYSRQFTFPIIQAASIANVLQSAVASAERVFELLDEAEEIADPVAPRLLPVPATGRVTFEDVAFRYVAEKPLIEDLDLVVEPGQTVAIVGPTGAGKTTLVNLLMRFYDVDQGRITVDGIDTRELTRDDLRRTFGMVLQDAWLFKGTIRENVAYGAQGELDEAKFREAVEAAHVDHFVRTLPDGYDTVLDDDATNVSAGEKQLLDDRAGLPRRPAGPHPRRGDLVGGHADRGADPEGDEPADARPDVVRDRPPAVHDPRRGRDPGDEPGPDHRAGLARPADGQGRVLPRALRVAVRGGARPRRVARRLARRRCGAAPATA